MVHTRLSKPRPSTSEVSSMGNPMVMARRLCLTEVFSREIGRKASDATSESSLLRISSRSACTARTRRTASASNGSTTETVLKGSSKMEREMASGFTIFQMAKLMKLNSKMVIFMALLSNMTISQSRGQSSMSKNPTAPTSSRSNQPA